MHALAASAFALAALGMGVQAAPSSGLQTTSAYGYWRSLNAAVPASWCKCEGCGAFGPGKKNETNCPYVKANICSLEAPDARNLTDSRFSCNFSIPRPSVTCPALFDVVQSSVRCKDAQGNIHAEGSEICVQSGTEAYQTKVHVCNASGSFVEAKERKVGLCSTSESVGSNTVGCPTISKVKLTPVCQSSDCKQIADDLNQYIDWAMDPCENFYEMVCHKFIDENRYQLQNRTGFSYFSKISDNAQRIITSELNSIADDNSVSASTPQKIAAQAYKSCLNVDARSVTGLKQLTDAVDGFANGTVSLEAALATLHQQLNTFSFFNWGVSPGKNGKPQVFVFVDQDNYPYYQKVLDGSFNKLENAAAKTSYLTYVNTVVGLLANTTTNADGQQGKDIVNFERTLMNKIKAYEATLLPLDKVAHGIVEGDHTRSAEEKARRWMDAGKRPELVFPDADAVRSWSWGKYLEAWGVSDYNDADDTNYQYLDPTAKDLLMHILTTTPTADLVKYLRYTIVAGNSDLPKDFLAAETSVRTVYGLGAVAADPSQCSNAINTKLDMAVTRIFVDAAFPASKTQDLKVMIENIRAAFLDDIKTIDWLDEETRKAAIKKLNSVIAFAGHPEGLRSDAWLNNYYKTLKGADTSNYVAFAHKAKAHLSRQTTSVDQLRNPVGRDQWNSGNPMTVNAYYQPSRNTIAMLQGILAYPFFDTRNPQSLNYGATGMVIGHEFTHGFDSSGRNYDEIGNRRNWWTANDAARFKAKAQCFIDQYSQWDFPDHPKAGTKNNGTLTLPENIADNGGVRHAYYAYKKYNAKFGAEEKLPNVNWDHDKLFFIGFGRTFCEINSPIRAATLQATDSHSPGPHRIWGALQNFEAFAEAFQCKKGSRYNPDKKCRIW